MNFSFFIFKMGLTEHITRLQGIKCSKGGNIGNL